MKREESFAAKGEKVKYMVGTMIEIPRAALVADEIAKTAQFFSFGTNDLTQTTMGMSRDDSVVSFQITLNLISLTLIHLRVLIKVELAN